MEVKRFADAKPYEVPNHRAYTSVRLFGAEAGGPKQFVVGLSHFLPGGGAGPDSSPTEKVYFILAGELTVIVGGKETVLKPNDSCFIGPNEVREVINRTQRRRDHAGRDLGAAEVTRFTHPGPLRRTIAGSCLATPKTDEQRPPCPTIS